MKENKEKKTLWAKIKYVCSITVKNDGRALDIIFVLCLISIIAFSVFLYRTSTNFYKHLDETMQNNINLNVEIMQNEQIERIQEILNRISQNTEVKTLNETADQQQASM